MASIFGHEAVFYAAVLNVVNTFAVFTVGVMLITTLLSVVTIPLVAMLLEMMG